MRFQQGGTISKDPQIQMSQMCWTCKRPIPGTKYERGELVVCRKCIKDRRLGE